MAKEIAQHGETGIPQQLNNFGIHAFLLKR
jgi:hypothetical protein